MKNYRIKYSDGHTETVKAESIEEIEESAYQKVVSNYNGYCPYHIWNAALDAAIKAFPGSFSTSRGIAEQLKEK